MEVVFTSFLKYKYINIRLPVAMTSMTIDLEKLQKLSCLSLDESAVVGLEKSIEGVVDMMGAVAELHKVHQVLPQETQPELTPGVLPKELLSGFSKESELSKLSELSSSSAHSVQKKDLENDLISTQNNNLNLSDGYFLAPKAIKR